ncbi:MAG TPA: AraC family transcriptional regulator [Chthoniobacteraceae bacterium]|jgi:AraC-like DNA-binding protein|nr:AraC family transcriptional regulator [Chthoniobacteraceae bacterium]
MSTRPKSAKKAHARSKPVRPAPAPAGPGAESGQNAAVLLRHAAIGLQPPASLFSGLRWEHGMAPDNIVFFKRTDASAFRPEGVSNNFHHRFELVVVIERGGPVRIGDCNFQLEPVEAALIFPNQFHHYMDVSQGRMEWLFITFELANHEEIAALRDSPRVLDGAQLHLLSLIVMEYVHPASGRPDVVEISYNLSRLLRGLVHASEIDAGRCDIHSGGSAKGIHSADRPRDIILEKINRYVRSHLEEAPTIGELARALDYSVSHLRAVFRDQLGVSLGRYIRESRLSQASSLLLSTDKNVSEVARESGFRSLFSFSRAFKKAYGMAPKAYSKTYR